LTREEGTTKGTEFLGKHMIPAILGPKQRHTSSIITSCPCASRGVKDILVTVVANLRKLHPFDDQGRRRDYADLPKAVSDLVDDPFRSLAGELRCAGRYAKGYDSVQRIPLGRFFASADKAPRRRNGDGAATRSLLGILPMFGPPRNDSKATIEKANKKGVRVKMVPP
jgi:hypothetical protein